MEDFRRPQRPAAVHQQRQIHYGREAVEQQPSHIAAPVQPAQPVMPAVTPPPPTISVDLRLQWPKFRRARALWHKLFTAQRRRKLRRVLSNLYLRVSLITMALVIVASQIYPLVEGFLTPHSYDLGRSEPLLQKTNESLGKKLELSAKDNSFMFNQDYSPVNQTDSSTFGGAAIKATANVDASKGLTVTDPNLNIDFTIKPQFQTLSGRQDQNRVVYPLMDGTGWMVYTMQAGGVKEDILLDHANGDTMKIGRAHV